MREESERRQRPLHRPSGPAWLEPSPFASTSILLPAIKDQQIYLALTTTFLALARDAGAPQHSLQQVAHSLLSARGFQQPKMLRDRECGGEDYRAVGQEYDWLGRGCSVAEMRNLLEKMEREMLEARQREKQYRCLQKYKRAKEEEIAPSFASAANTRKERFKRTVNGKYSKQPIQSSNFYQFDVNQILQNTFKAENECYKTINSFVHLKTMYGHAADQDIESYSPTYNAIFDRSQNFIITSGEEGLIKVWHKGTGTLIRNLKGHTDFLNKIDTSKCNKYLLSCAGDGVRFFDLKTFKPLGGWKTNSIDEITSFVDEQGKSVFLFGENSQLYLLSEEVMLASANRRLQLSDFMIFSFSEIIGKENAAIIVISLSPQKTHVLIGLQTGQFLMILMSTLQQVMQSGIRGEKIELPAFDPIKAHHQQIVEIKWSDGSHQWATGSKDGRCCLWEMKGEQITLINTLSVNRGQRGKKKRNFSCTYICWNCTYSHFAASFQENVNQEDTERGQGEVLVYSLKERRVTCELSRDISLPVGGIRAMDAHPQYPNILLICEAQGHVILFDLFLGCIVNVFQERGYHIMHPQFSLIPTECRFTQDGLYFIVSSQYGSVSLYGYDSKAFFALSPSEQFLETDFVGIEIDENSMKALPVGLDFNDDVNDYPVGPILTIKGEPYQNILRIKPQELLFAVNNPSQCSLHRPQVALEEGFMSKLAYSLRQGAQLEFSYQKTYEQIQNSKQIILFHQRERQYSKIVSLTSNKIDHLKAHHHHSPVEEQNMAYLEEEEPIVRTRKLKRHTQRERVNYADDVSYDQSEEEDFNLIEQELPEEMEDDDEESSPEEEEPRLRKRERTRIRRQTRQTNPVRYNEPDVIQSEERMPTRSRNHAHYREQDDASESIPKKRTKHEHQQQSEQPKKYSRLRKQALSSELQQPLDCYRCQLVKATQHCDKCGFTQQYCYECSLMRGRKIKDKFKCIICLFLQNQSQEEYEHVSEEVYRWTRNRETYVPQLEDSVRFFFQGYEEFLVQNVDRLNNEVVKRNAEFRILPHTEDLQLLNLPLCRVKSIEYIFPVKGTFVNSFKRNPGKGEPTPILMLLGLARESPKAEEKLENHFDVIQSNPMKEEEQAVSEKEDNIFWVFYIPGSDFLLPQEIYSQIAEKELVSKFVNNQLILIKDEEMQIVEISPFEDRYPQSIWKLIKIRKTEGKRLRGNTKEIQRRINIWKVSQDIEQPPQSTCIEAKHTQRLVSYLQTWREEESPFRIFVDYVDFQIYPLYRHQVPVGICLETILERLKNNYYRSYESLKADFDRIYNNSVIFNGEMHTVTQSALQLKNRLYSLLLEEDEMIHFQVQQQQPQLQPQSQPVSNSKKTQEQSNSKKQRKKRESEEYIDPAYVSTQRRRTRKDNTIPTRLKRRKDSSQYQQSSISLQQGVGVSTRGGRGKQQEQQNKRMTRSRNKNT